MSALVTNNGVAYLLVGIDDEEQRILLKSGQGSRFPSPVVDKDWFYITVEDAEGNVEVMRCTQRDNDTLDVVRGSDGTVARSFKADSLVELRPCAGLFNDKVDADVFEAQMAELRAEMAQFRLEMLQRYGTFEVEVDNDLQDIRLDSDDKYMPYTGGTFTGGITVEGDVTATGTAQAGSFQITPEET